MSFPPVVEPPFSRTLAEQLLDEWGSPLYVYQAQTLDATAGQIEQAVNFPRTRLYFASVTNGNLALLRRFRGRGWGLHGNTPGDCYLAQAAGFLPEELVYSGSNLNREEMGRVLTGAATLNLDSLDQVRMACEVYSAMAIRAPRLGLRLYYPEITGESRIGIHPDEFAEAVRLAGEVGLAISVLHFYRGTGTSAVRAFTGTIEALATIGRRLPDWSVLDLGGGFGYPYRQAGLTFDWEALGASARSTLERVAPGVGLWLEPGRAAVAGAGVLLARVVSCKWRGEQQILGVDTTVANLAVAAVHGGYRRIAAFEPGPVFETDVCGNTTYSGDYLGRGCRLPHLDEGSVVAVLDVGAYGYAMSSHFLHRPRPAEVLLVGERADLIRRREGDEALAFGQEGLL